MTWISQFHPKTECTIKHKIDGRNITRHEKKCATLRSTNGIVCVERVYTFMCLYDPYGNLAVRKSYKHAKKHVLVRGY